MPEHERAVALLVDPVGSLNRKECSNLSNIRALIIRIGFWGPLYYI